MLRITIHDHPGTLTFQLEGSLEGPWVRELETCWQNVLVRREDPTLRVDLTGMTSLDNAGQACLAALYREGAELVAADCLTKAVVAEITNGPGPADGHSERKAKSGRGRRDSPSARRPRGA
jgi:ABC-type transporter Mla MlaB component